MTEQQVLFGIADEVSLAPTCAACLGRGTGPPPEGWPPDGADLQARRLGELSMLIETQEANRESSSDRSLSIDAHGATESGRDQLWGNFPPGSKLPPLLQSMRYMLGPYESIDQDRRRYGNCFTIHPLYQPRMIVFSQPEAIREIFTAEPDSLVGGEAAAPLLGPILGWNSLVLLDGARYRHDRRLMMPTLHGERMNLYARTMRTVTDEAIDTWPIGHSFPIHDKVRAIVLEIFLRTIFGLKEEQRARLRDLQGRILAMADSPLSAGFIFLPTLRINLGRLSPWGRFLQLRGQLFSLLSEEITRCRSERDPNRTDVLALLAAARDEGGNSLSDQELMDEMFSLLMAGIETTTTSLTWIFHHVLANPGVLKKLTAERKRVLGDEPVAPEHIPNLEYLDAVIKESARLTPVTTDVARVLKKPMQIGGFDLPAGAGVSAGIYLTHHRPDLWPDPKQFDPERFIRSRPNPYTWFPFGGGERRCLGAAFSTYALKIAVTQALSRLQLRLAPGYRMRPTFHAITIAPSGGMPVIVEGRS
jgi:cytochrome P450